MAGIPRDQWPQNLEEFRSLEDTQIKLDLLQTPDFVQQIKPELTQSIRALISDNVRDIASPQERLEMVKDLLEGVIDENNAISQRPDVAGIADDLERARAEIFVELGQEIFDGLVDEIPPMSNERLLAKLEEILETPEEALIHAREVQPELDRRGIGVNLDDGITENEINTLQELRDQLASPSPEAEPLSPSLTEPEETLDVAPSPVAPAEEKMAIRGSGNQILQRDADVNLIQTQLIALGYDQVGPPDGIEGPLTRGAIRDFARDNDLDPATLTMADLKTQLQEQIARNPEAQARLASGPAVEAVPSSPIPARSPGAAAAETAPAPAVRPSPSPATSGGATPVPNAPQGNIHTQPDLKVLTLDDPSFFKQDDGVPMITQVVNGEKVTAPLNGTMDLRNVVMDSSLEGRLDRAFFEKFKEGDAAYGKPVEVELNGVSFTVSRDRGGDIQLHGVEGQAVGGATALQQEFHAKGLPSAAQNPQSALEQMRASGAEVTIFQRNWVDPDAATPRPDTAPGAGM